MTKVRKREVLKEIIKCEGDCSGFNCDGDDNGKCPLYNTCNNVNSTMITYEDKLMAARIMLKGLKV